MLDFVLKTFLGLGAALVLGVAAPATAATFNVGGGWSGSNPSCNVTGSFANNSSDIDVWSGAAFGATFANTDTGGNLCFNFNNSSTTDAAVTIAVATVNQQGSDWGFLGGVQLFSEQSGSTPIWTVAQGVSALKEFTFLIAASSSIYFDWSYGDPYTSKTFNFPQINFTVGATPVPVPAAGLLLLGALGGLAALRRRKSV